MVFKRLIHALQDMTNDIKKRSNEILVSHKILLKRLGGADKCTARKTTKSIIKKHLARSEKYVAGLSKHDKKVIRAYQLPTDGLFSNKKHIYTFNQLNAYLRGGENPHLEKEEPLPKKQQKILEKNLQQWTEELTELIANAPKSKNDITVYRGVFGMEGFPKLKKGKTITIDGFMSTSWRTNIPEQYAARDIRVNVKWNKYYRKHNTSWFDLTDEKRNQLLEKYGPPNTPVNEPWCCFMEIEIPKGTPLLMPTFYEAQKEIVLPHQSKLLYLGKTICSISYFNQIVTRTMHRFRLQS